MAVGEMTTNGINFLRPASPTGCPESGRDFDKNDESQRDLSTIFGRHIWG
jgi:hypothetical protein